MEVRRNIRKTALFVVPLLVLALALGIWMGHNTGKTDPSELPPPVTTAAPPETTAPTEPWAPNILRSDEIPTDSDDYFLTLPAEYSVFGSDYQRQQISAVAFLDTLSGAPVDAWDVSAAGDGSVMAWVEPEGDLYRLTIASEGGVIAGTSCAGLFHGYENMTRISFGSNFNTAGVKDMSRMFCNCRSLSSLDLSGFNTSAVQDMSGMFVYCYALTSLDLSSFDTSAVQDMSDMF